MSGEHPRRVWGVGTSRTIRPHWMLCELGLPYETHEIVPRTESMRDPGFLAASNAEKVPVLEDDGQVIAESAAMVVHLADRYRDRIALSPELDSSSRALFLQHCFFVMTELDAPLYVVRRHEGLPSIYGEAPVAVDSAKEYFLRQCGRIAKEFADSRPYLLGDTFNGCDLLLYSCLVWARVIGIGLPTSLDAYCERIAPRPGLAEAMTRNFPPHAMAALRAQS